MKILIKRISPSSLAAILAAIYFIIGCVFSLIILLGGALGQTLMLKGPINCTLPLKPTFLQAAGIAIVYPFLCAFMGVVAGFVLAWLFNFVSRFLKGLLIETDDGIHNED